MEEKRFKKWSPELDLDLTDKIQNQYQEYEINEEDIEEEHYIPKENNMKKLNPKVIWIIVLVIFFVWFLFTIDLKTQEQPIDLKTQEQINNLSTIANEYKMQKQLRQEIKERQIKLSNSINNVKKLEEKNDKLNREVLQLIK